MIAQIYTATDGENTSVLVSNEKGNVYFSDVLETPEITGIQRGVSFVKHNIAFDKTEIYPDRISPDEVMNDAYINFCKVKHSIGNNPNEKSLNYCKRNLSIYRRWNVKGKENARNS